MCAFLGHSALLAQHCVPQGNCTVHITKVLSSNAPNINYTSGNCSPNGYGDFSFIQDSIAAGSSLDIQVHVGGFGTGNVPNFTCFVFIDLNENGILNDKGEVVQAVGLTNASAGNPHFVASVPIPANTTAGLKRIRVRTMPGLTLQGDPCGSHWGEAEDYSVYVKSAGIPSFTCVSDTTVYPAQQQQNVCQKTFLRWGEVIGADRYFVSLVNKRTQHKIFDNTSTTDTELQIPGTLVSGDTYKWIVIPEGPTGRAENCDSLSFTVSFTLDPRPNFTPVRDTNLICQNTSLQIDGSPTQGTSPYSHSWNRINGTGNTELSDTSIQRPSFISNNVELYKYAYRVTDVNGCYGQDTFLVDVIALPQHSSLVASTTNICEGENVSFSLDVDPNDQLQWQDSTGIAGYVNSPPLLDLGNGNYESSTLNFTTGFRATLRNGQGCSSTTNEVVVNVHENPTPPDIEVQEKSTNCEGDTVILSLNSAQQITWNDAANTEGPVVNIFSSGLYKATVTTSEGCSAETNAVTITFRSKPQKQNIIKSPTGQHCEGEQVSLEIVSNETIEWNDPDKTTNKILQVSNEGSYYAKITNNFGCSNFSDTVTVAFQPNPEPVEIKSNRGFTACIGDSIRLYVNTNLKTTWSDPNNTDSKELWVKTGGIYFVTIENEFGCTYTSPHANVFFQSKPNNIKIQYQDRDPLCDGDSIILSLSSFDAVEWNVEGKPSGPNLVAYNSGAYSASLIDRNGCKYFTDTIQLEFKPRPSTAEINSSNGKFSGCIGDSLNLQIISEDSIVWNTTPNSSQKDLLVKESGNYGATLINEFGCRYAIEPVVVSFHNLPERPSINYSGDAIACDGEVVILSSSQENGILWNDSLTWSNQILSVTTDGLYYHSYTDQNGCSSFSDTVSLSFKPLPVKPKITRFGDQLLAQSNGTYYDWFLENHGLIDNSGDSLLTPVKSGLYRVIAYSEFDCISDSSDWFEFDNTVGINQGTRLENTERLIYPNPSKSSINIDLRTTITNQTLRVYNQVGKLVFQKNLEPGLHRIDHKLKAGIYVINIFNNSENISVPLVVTD